MARAPLAASPGANLRGSRPAGRPPASRGCGAQRRRTPRGVRGSMSRNSRRIGGCAGLRRLSGSAPSRRVTRPSAPRVPPMPRASGTPAAGGLLASIAKRQTRWRPAEGDRRARRLRSRRRGFPPSPPASPRRPRAARDFARDAARHPPRRRAGGGGQREAPSSARAISPTAMPTAEPKAEARVPVPAFGAISLSVNSAHAGARTAE